MPNYANTQLYELIEHDENGVPVVYRGHTTQPLHKRLADHRGRFKEWKNGKNKYCSSFEVLKHGPARIELVRVVCCFNVKEANREEGKFIRELSECVNIRKNTFTTFAEYRKANKEARSANHAEWYEANKQTILAKKKEYRQTNRDTILAKKKEYRKANNETIKAKRSEKVTCECGAVVGRGDISRHHNTWKHIHDFIHL